MKFIADDCNNCSNIGICKFIDEFRDAKNNVSNLTGLSEDSPLNFTIKCEMFAQKRMKQDGLFMNKR